MNSYFWYFSPLLFWHLLITSNTKLTLRYFVLHRYFLSKSTNSSWCEPEKSRRTQRHSVEAFTWGDITIQICRTNKYCVAKPLNYLLTTQAKAITLSPCSPVTTHPLFIKIICIMLADSYQRLVVAVLFTRQWKLIITTLIGAWSQQSGDVCFPLLISLSGVRLVQLSVWCVCCVKASSSVLRAATDSVVISCKAKLWW